jgi:hypothetical protein
MSPLLSSKLWVLAFYFRKTAIHLYPFLRDSNAEGKVEEAAHIHTPQEAVHSPGSEEVGIPSQATRSTPEAAVNDAVSRHLVRLVLPSAADQGDMAEDNCAGTQRLDQVELERPVGHPFLGVMICLEWSQTVKADPHLAGLSCYFRQSAPILYRCRHIVANALPCCRHTPSQFLCTIGYQQAKTHGLSSLSCSLGKT